MARTHHTDTLTTGQVADICQVGISTVTQWLEDGQIPHFWLPARHGTRKKRERRVYREDLAAFLVKCGNFRAAERVRPGSLAAGVLVLATARPWFDQLAAQVGEQFKLHYAYLVIEAGAICARVQPRLAVIDFSISRADAQAVAGWLRRQEPRPLIAALLPEDQPEAQAARGLTEYGFGAWWQKPVDPATVAGWMTKGC